jgi:hypothetical protein
MKLCKGCGELRGLENFYKDKTRVDGYHYYCKSCNNVKDKGRYQKNKQTRCDQSNNYYKENKELIKEKQRLRYSKNIDYYRKWSQDNKDLVCKNVKNWTIKNRSKINEYNRHRRKTDPRYAMIENLRSRAVI